MNQPRNPYLFTNYEAPLDATGGFYLRSRRGEANPEPPGRLMFQRHPDPDAPCLIAWWEGRVPLGMPEGQENLAIAVTCEADETGTKAIIPAWLHTDPEFGFAQRKIKLINLGDHFEVWSKQNWENMNRPAPVLDIA